MPESESEQKIERVKTEEVERLPLNQASSLSLANSVELKTNKKMKRRIKKRNV